MSTWEQRKVLNRDLTLKETATIKRHDGTIVFDPSEKVYEALLSYDGTDLVVSLLKNSLGEDIAWVGTDADTVTGTLTDGFPTGRSSVEVSDADLAGSFSDGSTVVIAGTSIDTTGTLVRIAVKNAVIATNPTVSAQAASGVTIAGATLNGTADSVGDTQGAQVRFVYDTSAQFDSDPQYTDWQSVTEDSETFSADISGLTAETQYYFEAQILNRNGVTIQSADGEDFITLAEE